MARNGGIPDPYSRGRRLGIKVDQGTNIEKSVRAKGISARVAKDLQKEKKLIDRLYRLGYDVAPLLNHLLDCIAEEIGQTLPL